MSKSFLFSSESVTEGHPDKICDQISDAIVDALLTADPSSRVAAEVVVSTGMVILTGEITSQAHVNFTRLVRDKLAEIGYTDARNGFSADSCAVLVAFDEQSPDIAQGVNRALESRTACEDEFDLLGAGDQGLMFGFACDETPELMPLPISLAHRLSRQLAIVRKNGTLPYLRPDGKTQVTVAYEGGRPVGIHTLLISTQHTPTIGSITEEAAVQERIRADLWEAVVKPVFAELPIKPNSNTRFLTNPTGKFVIGGPQGDAGLTGRKIIVDTYGGYARHGGGAFSGKDPTKVDRSAAYAARYVAKNIVAAGLAQKCEVQVSYAIGVARPINLLVETFGTGRIPDEDLLRLVQRHFDLRPAAILAHFQLQELPRQRGGRFYQNVAVYGHFGQTHLDLPWERTDKAALLREEALSSSRFVLS
ncbi:methionine adenosyltransferase [Synechococcus sp. H70.2]|uniref:methionine adenosyltransferase n=1 Tax=unclassified Synechococcus TaxID=2626047 RepID=UPI0039C0D348